MYAVAIPTFYPYTPSCHLMMLGTVLCDNQWSLGTVTRLQPKFKRFRRNWLMLKLFDINLHRRFCLEFTSIKFVCRGQQYSSWLPWWRMQCGMRSLTCWLPYLTKGFWCCTTHMRRMLTRIFSSISSLQRTGNCLCPCVYDHAQCNLEEWGWLRFDTTMHNNGDGPTLCVKSTTILRVALSSAWTHHVPR